MCESSISSNFRSRSETESHHRPLGQSGGGIDSIRTREGTRMGGGTVWGEEFGEISTILVL